MTVQKRDFPKTIYVAVEESDDEKFLVASSQAADHAVMDDDRLVAVYQLVKLATLTNKSELNE